MKTTKKNRRGGKPRKAKINRGKNRHKNFGIWFGIFKQLSWKWV